MSDEETGAPVVLITITLNRVELMCVLRNIRARREALQTDFLGLQEKLAGMGDGHTESALVVMATEIDLLDGLTGKLWRSYVRGPI